MSAEFFLDTNVIVYAFDRSSADKRQRSLDLLRRDDSWVISWQVVQEFCSVALHRFAIPLTPEFLNEYLDVILLPQCKVMSSASLYQMALQIHRQTQFRFYDSLIVAAALESGASILYSEDMQAGRRIGDLQIANPFAG